GPDRGSNKGGEIRAASQRGAQVLRKASDVHSAAGVDFDACGARHRVVVQKADGEDLHHARAPLNRLTTPGLAVEGLAALLERRIERGHLVDVAREFGEGRLDPLAVDGRWASRSDDGAVAVAGVGGDAVG